MTSPIELAAVESSNLAGVGYDPESQTLAVQFKTSGKVYHYPDVPPEVHAELLAAESIGSHFHINIRSAYKGAPIDPDKEVS